MRLAASRYKNTKTVTHRYTAKSWVGLTLFKLGVKGYFSYNGSKVKPHLNDAWYTRGTLSIWQVSGWHKGTYTKGSNYAEVYGRGNFHYGFEVKGVGLVIQDKYFKVYLSSNAKEKFQNILQFVKRCVILKKFFISKSFVITFIITLFLFSTQFVLVNVTGTEIFNLFATSFIVSIIVSLIIKLFKKNNVKTQN